MLGPIHKVGADQKVIIKAHGMDHLQLMLEPLLDLWGDL